MEKLPVGVYLEITSEYTHVHFNHFRTKICTRHFRELKISCRGKGYETREKLIVLLNHRYGGTSVENKPTGLHSFDPSQGDYITNQYFMGGNCE